MNDKVITIVLGAIITILGVFGVVEADEGTQLTGYGSSVITGIIGIVEIVRGIIKRRKGVSDGK